GRLRGRHHRGEARAGDRIRALAGAAVPGASARLPGNLPALGLPRQRQRHRVVLDAEPAHSDRLQRLHGKHEVCRRQRVRRRRLGLLEREPLQHLAGKLVHRSVPAGRHQRHSARAVRMCAPRVQESLAPLLDIRSAGTDARMSPRPWWRKLAHAALVVLATVYCVFPIYFMLVQSLKTAQEDVFGNPLIVMNPTLENFQELFEREGEVRGFVGDALRRSYPFLDWLANTLVVFAGSVAATLVASVAAAYALGRLRPPGFRWWRRAI